MSAGRPERQRIAATAGVLAMVFAVLTGRAVQLTVLEGEELKNLALRQHRQQVALPPKRGPIVDRSGEPLALTTESAAVYVRPRELKAGPEVLNVIARLLHLPPNLVAAKAASPASFVWLDRRVPLERWEAVAEMGIPGIGSEPTRQRLYPHGDLAGQLLGFVGIDGQGLEGVEQWFDAELRGEVEALAVERDARGRRMVVEGRLRPLPRVGAQVQLTLDAAIQRVTQNQLEEAVKKFEATAATAVVMDPRSGEILAMATVPGFDPNHFNRSTPDQWRIRAITDSYEPGSTFKAILAAAAIEEAVVKPADLIYCERGRYAVGRRLIHDAHPKGMLTFAGVIAESSNIGSAKIAERLGKERYFEIIERFGFGALTGIGLRGEVPGLLRPVSRWGRIHLVTNAFGQGLAVTPLQLTRAFAAIANGGLLMRPYLVRRVIDENGQVKYASEPEVQGRVVSRETAATVTEMLRGVVEQGTGKQAKIEGIAVAGKTGTAQKVDVGAGRYHPRDRMSSFVGFAPADNPRVVILVVVDTPRKATYGGVVAAPVFRNIAEFALDRLGVRPWNVQVPHSEFEAAADALPVEGVFQVVSTSLPNVELPGMPSFIGLSMREALIRAHRAGLQVQVHGSGYVVSQDPPAGSAPSALLTLEFGSDAG